MDMTGAQAFLAARDFLLAHPNDYRTACRDFRWPRLDRFNWALDYFDAMASGNDGTALWIVDEQGSEMRLSFAQMAERSNRVANSLRSRGVRRGDRVLLMLGNEAPLWDTLLAAFKLGAVVIPATSLLGPADLRDRLGRGAVRHVIAGSAHAAKFADVEGDYTRIAVGEPATGWYSFDNAYTASADFVPDGETCAADPLLLYFTSGTTARPKLVEHSHESYPVGHLTTMYWIGLGPGDTHWNISSPGWAKHAYSCLFAPWNAGATVFVYNYGRFNPREALRLLAQKPITTMCAPPTVWRMLVQERLTDYAVHLRECVSAGEPLNPEVIAQVRAAWGIEIRDGYGQTETTIMAANFPGQPVKPGSMGKPAPGYRMVLSETGEICVDLAERPTGLMAGYAGQGLPTINGCYATGDIGVCDDDGCFTYIGRADDVFKASDYRISPFEVESALIEHPAVAEAAVVPSPDPVRGLVPKAFIVVAAGYTPGEDLARDIFAFLRRTVAPYKRVRRIEFSELPKTISGKIRRAELRHNESGRGAERTRTEFWEG
jgi:acetyl-CoA synthetase